REQQELLTPVQRLSLFIEEILLVEIKQKIVIFVDEIDRVLSQKFSLDDFFGLIRYCHDQRDTNSNYQRLTFALLGVTTPSDLIQDTTQTPFNIGQAIQLQGFKLDEVQPLIEGLLEKFTHPEAIIKNILYWTGGQPFLTQKLCQVLIRVNNIAEQEENLELVAQVVQSCLVENWEFQDEPDHLTTIRDRIIRNEQKAVQLLGIYQKIVDQGEIAADGSTEQMELRLSGLVVEKQGKLKVYNLIYQTVFDQNWVEKNLQKLRPYAEAMAAWIASGSQDQSYLLQGSQLQDALTWTLGKHLCDDDYRFLVASQTLAKQQTEKLLEATEQASQLLASARSKAKREAQKMRIGVVWIPFITVTVALPILLLRWSGLLQGLEWSMLDQFFRWRSPEPSDPRIAIVTIDETDLTEVGQWPIPDGILAEAITNIKAQSPQGIGLDLYRNLPIEPGHSDLVTLFQSTPILFGIEKIVDNPVAPSPVLSQQEQVGFSDIVLDDDGKVRRALLSLVDAEGTVRYSLGTILALYYLKGKEITLKSLDQGQRVSLGKAIFERFTGNDGGYVGADSGGYQIVLNYRGQAQDFSTFSLTDVLNNNISPHSFSDRLVFIGTTAESINDLYYTPYSGQLSHVSEMMPGIAIHANIASQLLSSALEGRPLIRVWPDVMEWLGILTMALIGTGISWWLKSGRIILLSLLLVSSGVLAGCYLAFLSAWWLPLIPCLLAFFTATIVLWFINNKQRDKIIFTLTLDLLSQTLTDKPTVGRIAMQYLKQSENKENQVLIAQKLSKKLNK
ncbi:MAG: CHASE2 domain-containing protein, partial [Crocosphaera sp.]